MFKDLHFCYKTNNNPERNMLKNTLKFRRLSAYLVKSEQFLAQPFVSIATAEPFLLVSYKRLQNKKPYKLIDPPNFETKESYIESIATITPVQYSVLETKSTRTKTQIMEQDHQPGFLVPDTGRTRWFGIHNKLRWHRLLSHHQDQSNRVLR